MKGLGSYQLRELRELQYHLWKIRSTLCDIDSAYRFFALGPWIFLALWMGAMAFVVDPVRYALTMGMVIPFLIFFGKYAAIGFVRRRTEKYFSKSFAGEERQWEAFQKPGKAEEFFLKHKPYSAPWDPPFTRWVYRTMRRFHLGPKRGFAHWGLFVVHLALLGYLLAAYCHFVCGTAPFPEYFWWYQGAFTLAVAAVLVKNFWVVIDAKVLLLLLRAVIGLRGGNVPFDPETLVRESPLSAKKLAEYLFREVGGRRGTDSDCCPYREFANLLLNIHPLYARYRDAVDPVRETFVEEIKTEVERNHAPGSSLLVFIGRKIKEIAEAKKG